MCKNELIIETIKKMCHRYSMEWADTAIGILVFNGREYFLLKLNKNHTGIRKMYHQNHAKNSKHPRNRIDPLVVNNDFLHMYFHTQEWNDSNIVAAMTYIHNHGIARAVQQKYQKELERRVMSYEFSA